MVQRHLKAEDGGNMQKVYDDDDDIPSVRRRI